MTQPEPVTRCVTCGRTLLAAWPAENGRTDTWARHGCEMLTDGGPAADEHRAIGCHPFKPEPTQGEQHPASYGVDRAAFAYTQGIGMTVFPRESDAYRGFIAGAEWEARQRNSK